MAFEKFSNVIEIEFVLKTVGTLTIGAGDQSGGRSNATIMRIGGKPVLPGSSLKGAVRANIEAILADRSVAICVPFTSVPKEKRGGNSINPDYLQKIGREAPCDPDRPCPVCSLFGTVGGRKGMSGRAIFMDAEIPGFQPGQVINRSHVAITRDTRSQSDGSLMSLETINAGTDFKGKIRLVNPENWMVGAVLRGLETAEQLGIGAKKTSGYGQFNLLRMSALDRRLGKDGWKEQKIDDLSPYTQAFDQREW